MKVGVHMCLRTSEIIQFKYLASKRGKGKRDLYYVSLIIIILKSNGIVSYGASALLIPPHCPWNVRNYLAVLIFFEKHNVHLLIDVENLPSLMVTHFFIQTQIPFFL